MSNTLFDLDEIPLDVPPEASESIESEPVKPRRSGRWRAANGLALLALLLGCGLLLVRQFDKPAQLTDVEVIDSIGELTELPVAETPIVATVEDSESLITQDRFYEGSVAGDKIIVYPLDGTAIIYRPSSNTIIKQGTTDTTPQLTGG